jgi:YjgF/chorismate_mutase-like, putative endoribonuclease
MADRTPEERLAAMGLVPPDAPAPMANDVPYRWAGNLLFVSGQGPKRPDGGFEAGRLGRDATVEDGYRAARMTGLQLLSPHRGAEGIALR